MAALGLFALGNLKHDFGLLWTWLCHRSFWQLAFGAMVALFMVQHFTLAGERRHSAKVEAQLKSATDQLAAISSKRNDQAKTTAENVKIVTRTIHDADGRAKVVEQAPLPGGCASPKEVLQADL